MQNSCNVNNPGRLDHEKKTGRMGDLLMNFSHTTGKMNEEFYFFLQVVCKYFKISPSPAGL
jgi:hypothetical protein